MYLAGQWIPDSWTSFHNRRLFLSMLETYVHPSDLKDFIQQKESCHICIVAFMTYSNILAVLFIVRAVYTTHACLTINQLSSHLRCVSTLPK